MPKQKGCKGGRLVRLSPSQYSKTLEYLLKNYNPDTDHSLSPKQKHSFKARAEKFVVLSDQKEGEWPHGPQLYIKTYTHQTSPLPQTTKLFVPRDKVSQIIGKRL